ncbi:down syndrome cell adhesion molecule-like protein Dscam2, partial [Caerostris extrusa]
MLLNESRIECSLNDLGLNGGILLPLHHRQKVSHGGTLSIQSVQRAADQGEYSCVVRSVDGENGHRDHIRVRCRGRRRQNQTGVHSEQGDPPSSFPLVEEWPPFQPHGDTAIQTTEDSSIVTFKKVTSADRGLYSCVATNAASSANMTMQLIVN